MKPALRLPVVATVLVLALAAGGSPARAQPVRRVAPVASATRVQQRGSERARPTRRPLRSRLRRFARQSAERAKLLAVRAATFPAFAWPLTKVARTLAHGEPLLLSSRSAVRIASDNAEHGVGSTIGRLASDLRDPWSVRGAERSYGKLIDRIARARAKDPRVDASIAFDPYSFGYSLAGVPQAERERTAMDGMLRVARRAKARGVAIEIDQNDVEAMPFTLRAAHRIVTELKVPVRVAIPARYQQSEKALAEWAALGKRTGIKVGVRLVKGSFVEADTPGVINVRGKLMDHYKRMITLAMENHAYLDIAVASQNRDILAHARTESRRLGAPYHVHVIRGVNPGLQKELRARGEISREYVSYGVDGPGFGLTELLNTWLNHRRLVHEGTPRRNLD